MTPVIDLPQTYRVPTASSAVVVVAPQYFSAEVVRAVDAADFPQGIDYDRWAGVARPSPRDAFADRLDLLDELPDD